MNKKSKFGVNVGKKSKITIEWRDKPENYSFESKKHIQSITSERYGVNKENVRVNFIPTQYNEKGEIVAFYIQFIDAELEDSEEDEDWL